MKYFLRILAVIGVTVLIALVGAICAIILIYKSPYEYSKAEATSHLEEFSYTSWIPGLMNPDGNRE